MPDTVTSTAFLSRTALALACAALLSAGCAGAQPAAAVRPVAP
ncbi:MAG: hypothetical protein JWQ72_3006, partial [Polaromonas sp.]|nr:hypothetical protein [Polaromonas sp.]